MKRSLLYGILIAGLFMVSVQGWAVVDVDTLASRLDYQRWVYPQEKLHVMTDLGQYMGGDTIWLRAFVADASTHQPVTMSKYVYVELLNPFDSVQNRVKLTHRRGGSYSGYIPLDARIAEGDYTLTAYTMFSENQGSEYFFRKKIPVRSPFGTRNEIESRFRTDGDAVVLDLSYTDISTGKAKDYAGMSLDTPDGKSRYGGRGLKDRSFRLKPEDVDKGVVRVRYNNYEKFISVPSLGRRDTMAVEFFPEGGYLVPGEACCMGIKAIGTDGYGRDVAGRIVDSRGATVAEFATFHRGMGVVNIVPQPGERYTAEMAVGAAGDTLKVALPEVNMGATVLHVDNRRGSSVTVSVAGKSPGQGSTIAIQSRGNLLYAAEATEGMTVTMPRERLPEGLIQILLTDGRGRALSERLIYNNGTGEEPAPVVAGELSAYRPRTLATVSLDMPHDAYNSGNFAVSVTDTRLAEADSASSLKAQLMLQSELRGHIEDAGYYFRNGQDLRTQAALDALLLTQGWRRYDVPAALRGDYTYPEGELEIGHQVTGQVRSRWRGKPVENATVQILNPKMLLAHSVKTDAEGRYTISGIDYPEGSKFVLQALLPKGASSYNFDYDEQRYPAVAALKARTGRIDGAEPESAKEDYGTQWKLSHNNGVMDILLDEVSITHYKYRINPDDDMFDLMAHTRMSADDLEKNNITTWDEVFRKIAGLRTNSGNVLYRGMPIAVFIDGVRWFPPGEDTDGAGVTDAVRAMQVQNGRTQVHTVATSRITELEMAVQISNVKKLRFLQPGMAVGFGVMNGALLIELKDGSRDAAWKQPDNLKLYVPLGYQKAAEFYAPKYDVDATPDGTDLRTTVYWNPCVELKNGRGEFSFYTNDSAPTTYTVRCQGLTDDGRIIDTTGTVTVK